MSEPVLPQLSLGRRVAVAVAGPILIAIPIVIVAFLVVITRAITQLIATAREQQEQLTADLAWEVARVNETLHPERRYFAMQTHGPIQSAAAAAAARLESVADSESLEQTWSGVYADLEGVIQGLGVGPSQARDVAGEVVNIGDPLPEDLDGGLCTSVFEDLCIDWGQVNAESGVQVWARIPVAVSTIRALV